MHEHMHMWCVCVCLSMWCMYVQRTVDTLYELSWFSFCTIWDQGLTLVLLSLVTSAFILGVLSPALLGFSWSSTSFQLVPNFGLASSPLSCCWSCWLTSACRGRLGCGTGTSHSNSSLKDLFCSCSGLILLPWSSVAPGHLWDKSVAFCELS